MQKGGLTQFDDASLENERYITQKERETIEQDMEQMLTVLNRHDAESMTKKLTLKSASKRFTFGAFVVVGITLFFLVSSGGAYLFVRAKSAALIKNQNTVNFAENILARLVIQDAQTAIQQNETEIKRITDQLDAQRQQQLEVERSLSDLQSYGNRLRAENDQEVAQLESQLRNQQVASSELQRQVERRRAELELRMNEQLKIYQDEQQRQLDAINSNIQVLQSQVNEKQNQVSTLQQSLQQQTADLEEQLRQQKESASAELSAANRRLEELRQNQQARAAAVSNITTAYGAALSAVNSGKYEAAGPIINNANSQISASPYKNDPEVLRIQESLSTLSDVVAEITALQASIQKSVASAADNRVDTAQKLSEYEARAAENQRQKTALEQALSAEKTRAAALQAQLDTLNKQTASQRSQSTAQTQDLQARYTALQKRYDELYAQGQRNMQLIVNYLFLKKDGSNTNSIKPLVDNLVKQDRYYSVIGSVIARAIDPSGQLQF